MTGPSPVSRKRNVSGSGSKSRRSCMSSNLSNKSLWTAAALLAFSTLTNTGCFWIAKEGPNLGAFSIPIPVSPYFQDKEEQRFWVHERYGKAPILGPIMPGGPVTALDTPSDD